MKKLFLLVVLVVLTTLGALVKAQFQPVEPGAIVIDGGRRYQITGTANLITNPGFEEGLEGWIAGNNEPLATSNFSIESSGGIDDSQYLRWISGHHGADGAGSIGTRWAIEEGKTYIFSFYVRYINPEKTPIIEQWLKVSLNNSETPNQHFIVFERAELQPGGAWSQNLFGFTNSFTNSESETISYETIGARFYWLNDGPFGFDEFALYEAVELPNIEGLQEVIDEAIELHDPDSQGAAAFLEAIQRAETYLASTSVEDVVKVIEELESTIALMKIVNEAMEMYVANYRGAATFLRAVETAASFLASRDIEEQSENGEVLKAAMVEFDKLNADTADVTLFFIANPSFETSGGWTFVGDMNAAQTNDSFNPYRDGARYMERWQNAPPVNDLSVTQVLTGLFKGNYTLRVPAHHTGGTVSPPTGAVIFVDDEEVSVSERTYYSIDFEVESDEPLTIGFKVENATGNWVACDDFRLFYHAGLFDVLGEFIAFAEEVYDPDMLGAAELLSAIQKTRGFLTSESTVDVTNAIIALLETIGSFEESNNPFPEVTEFLIANASFENALTGWENDGFVRATNANFGTFRAGGAFVENWASPADGGTIGDCSITQTLTGIPNGKYKLIVAAQHINENDPELDCEGAFVFAGDATAEVTVRAYYTVDFVVTNNTITIGFKIEDATGNWVACDDFRLYYEGALSDILAAVINQAEAFCDPDEPGAPGLLRAIQNAKGFLNSEWAPELSSAILDLRAAIERYLFVNDVISEIADASSENPIDVTDLFIINPSFEGSGGWVQHGGVNMTQGNDSFEGFRDGARYAERWVSTSDNLPDCGVTQILTYVPNGKYTLKAAAHNIRGNSHGESTPARNAFLFADDAQTEVGGQGEEDTGYGYYTVDFIVVNNTVTIGYKAVGSTGNWMACDNFQLEYKGGFVVESIVVDNSPITGVSNGVPKTAEGLGLPVATLETDDIDVPGYVDWDLRACTYDPDNRGEQTFVVSGEIIIPLGVTNPKNLPLGLEITVTVEASRAFEGIIAPAAITGVANGVPKTAAGLGLPETVLIEAGGAEVPATVTWNVADCEYEQFNGAEQTFVVEGVIALPTGVENPNDLSLDVSVTVTVDALPSLESIAAPAAITGLPCGTAKTVEALGLPATVKLVTDKGEFDANVVWNVAASEYDPDDRDEQVFDISGVVTLPANVHNPDNVPLTVTISITVEALDGTVLVSIATPQAITGVSNGVAKTAAGLGLPESVAIVTEDGDNSATVTWDVDGSSYNPDNKAAQTFNVSGVANLPEGVVNFNNISLDVTVSVTVDAAPVVNHAVTFSVVGGNGTITATVGGSAITSPANVVEGSNVNFTATPAQGFRVKEWTRDNSVVGGTANTYNLNNLTAATTVTVEFEAIPQTNSDELNTVNPIRAWTSAGLLKITGLTVGQPLSVYSASGALVYQSVAASDEAEVNLSAQGVYIINAGGYTLKVMFGN